MSAKVADLQHTHTVRLSTTDRGRRSMRLSLWTPDEEEGENSLVYLPSKPSNWQMFFFSLWWTSDFLILVCLFFLKRLPFIFISIVLWLCVIDKRISISSLDWHGGTVGFRVSISGRWQFSVFLGRIRGWLAGQRHESRRVQDTFQLARPQFNRHTFRLEGLRQHCERHVLQARWDRARLFCFVSFSWKANILVTKRCLSVLSYKVKKKKTQN